MKVHPTETHVRSAEAAQRALQDKHKNIAQKRMLLLTVRPKSDLNIVENAE